MQLRFLVEGGHTDQSKIIAEADGLSDELNGVKNSLE